MINIQRILCPVDLSPVSVTAVDYATSLAKSYGAAVYLLHVVSPIVPGFEYAVDIREVAQSLKERSTEEMGKLVAKLEDTSVIAGVEVRVGNVYDEIKTAIETIGPDIVLMGTHRRGGVERLFRGSTVEKLLRHSPAPIVTVPPEVRRHSPTSSFRRFWSQQISQRGQMRPWHTVFHWRKRINLGSRCFTSLTTPPLICPRRIAFR